MVALDARGACPCKRICKRTAVRQRRCSNRLPAPLGSPATHGHLRLTSWETEGELVYAFDLPGIPEEKIAVDLEDNTLTVSGSRERSEIEDGRFFRYERPFGEFTRSVALPEGTGDGEASAHYANGVLEVHVQKPEQSKPRRLSVTTTIESGGPTD